MNLGKGYSMRKWWGEERGREGGAWLLAMCVCVCKLRGHINYQGGRENGNEEGGRHTTALLLLKPLKQCENQGKKR